MCVRAEPFLQLKVSFTESDNNDVDMQYNYDRYDSKQVGIPAWQGKRQPYKA